jgi:DNA polymerase III alpha subunit (gram-positive type)
MNNTQSRLTDITFLAFDTETTGLHPIIHRLVEVGAVRFRLDGHELATFETLIVRRFPFSQTSSRCTASPRQCPGTAHC